MYALFNTLVIAFDHNQEGSPITNRLANEVEAGSQEDFVYELSLLLAKRAKLYLRRLGMDGSY